MPYAWEYRDEHIALGLNATNAKLNHLGMEGWELVTVVDAMNGGHRAIFKRELVHAAIS